MFETLGDRNKRLSVKYTSAARRRGASLRRSGWAPRGGLECLEVQGVVSTHSIRQIIYTYYFDFIVHTVKLLRHLVILKSKANIETVH